MCANKIRQAGTQKSVGETLTVPKSMTGSYFKKNMTYFLLHKNLKRCHDTVCNFSLFYQAIFLCSV